MKHKKAMMLAGGIGALSALTLYGEKRILDALFARDDKVMGDDREGKLYEYAWFDAMKPESIYLIAKDQVQLHAHYFPQPTNTHRYMILQHGFHGYVKELSYEAKHFYEKGYQLLMPSMRAHGLSGGALITMGLLEHEDTCMWIRYLRSMDPKAEIYIYGVSMGAATTLLALAEQEGVYIRAAISDCAYATAIGVFDSVLKKRLRIPYEWYLYASDDLIYRRTGIMIRESRPVDIVDKITTPTLFIHGDHDDLVPCEMVDALYERATCEKEKLIIAGAGHALASSKDPKTYWEHVDAFLDNYANTSEREPNPIHPQDTVA